MWVNTPVIWILWDLPNRFLRSNSPSLSSLARALLRLRFGDLPCPTCNEIIRNLSKNDWLGGETPVLSEMKVSNHKVCR